MYAKEFYSGIKNEDSKNFVDKGMEVENSERTEIKKDIIRDVFCEKCVLAPKLRIPTIKLIDHLSVNSVEDQIVDTSNPLRIGNKIIMGDRRV